MTRGAGTGKPVARELVSRRAARFFRRSFGGWVRTGVDRYYDGFTGRMPPELAGWIDLRRPSKWASWGGPLNGQECRRQMVRELARTIRFDRVLETGTFRGTTTEFLAAVFGAPVDTVEGNPRHFAFGSRRLSVLPAVTVELGDSRAFLARLAAQPRLRDETLFVYLDAHWEDDLPLADELRIIGRTWASCVVMVDDFQVTGDDGYLFDDYGPGKALVPDYLPREALPGWSLMYPSARSEEETGEKRGCCVLASPALAASAAVPGLREERIL